MILFIQFYKSIVDGVMTSIIDSFFNIRSFVNSEIKIICPEFYLLERNDYYNIPLKETPWLSYKNENGLETEEYESGHPLKYAFGVQKNCITTSIPFLKFNRNFGDFRLFYGITEKDKNFESDIIVCSARLIHEIMNGIDIKLKCKKLIVLDSLDTYKSKIGEFPDFDLYFNTLPNTKILQLSNPATFRNTKYEQREYYHKLSLIRLKSIRQTGNLKNEYTFSRRRDEKRNIGGGVYFENIGKSFFEYLYFVKKVNYSNDGCKIKDGMCFYMEKFGLDGFKNYENLKISKKEIENVLFIKKDDILLKETTN